MIKNTRGFSLIELMITVAIIGILVMIAQPIYSSYMIKIRHTQLMTHLLDISKRIEIELDSGSDSLTNSMASMFCKPGSLQSFTNTKADCTQNGIFSFPQGTEPPGGMPSKLTMEQLNDSFFISWAISYPDSSTYELSYGINDDGITILLAQTGPRGSMLEKLYSTQESQVIFIRILMMYKGTNMILYDKDLNKKQVHPIWYCGFSSIYAPSLSTMPMTSETPVACKHIVTDILNTQTLTFYEM